MEHKSFMAGMAVCICLLFCACTGEKEKKEIERLNAQVDSLQKANEQNTSSMNDMMSFVNVLADGLDSIAKQENVLFYTNKGPEGIYVNREQLKKNLEMFEQTLQYQRERIASLTDSLQRKGMSVEKMNNLIKYLNSQIDQKDELISSLRSDLNNKNLSIAQLRQRVQLLTEHNTKLNEKVETQKEALATQSEIINECYFKIGTKKQLIDLGIISGGLLKKTKVNTDKRDKNMFMRVDIRSFTEVPINSANPKILTQMPASSYRIEKHGNTSTLYILDPTTFWSISNYLIIQTK